MLTSRSTRPSRGAMRARRSDMERVAAARRKVIVVAPHFPPSNLAAVHRARLFVRHLPEFGWEPIVVTVHHRYYEEKLDWNLAKLVDERVRVERVGAIPTKPVR